MGLAEAEKGETYATMDEADLDRASAESLPPIYRRLFRLEPLQSEEFLMARSSELEVVRQAFERWSRGRPGALAIVGEMGSGKTSLINCAERTAFGQHRVVRYAFSSKAWTAEEIAGCLGPHLGFPEVTCLHDMESGILRTEDRTVVVLESGHELFLRRIGGLEGLKQLLLTISRTHSRVFWVLSMTEYAWQHLDSAVRVSDYFPYVIETRNISADDMEKAIMMRHGVSGFGLRFLVDESPSKSIQRRLRKASDDSARQTVLRAAFFDRLDNVSRGNILIALFYWLQCVRAADGDTMEVAPLKPPQFGFLNQLDSDKLFTLAALLQHGTLTTEEHAAVFHSSVMSSQLLLETLLASNLIQLKRSNGTQLQPHDGDSGRYTVNPVTRGPVVRTLQARHILY